MKVAQELKEAHIARQGGFTDPSKHTQIRLEQRKETRGSVLMHLPARVFLLRVVHRVTCIAHYQPIAAGRVRVEPTARLHGEVGSLLHRLDRKVPRRLDHDTALAAHPGDNGRSVFVVMTAPGLALLAAPPWRAAQ